jgi:hypothetical protein
LNTLAMTAHLIGLATFNDCYISFTLNCFGNMAEKSPELCYLNTS